MEKSTNYAKPQFQQVYSKKQNSIEHVLNIDDFSPLSNALTPMNLITNKFGFRNDALLGIVKGSQAVNVDRAVPLITQLDQEDSLMEPMMSADESPKH